MKSLFLLLAAVAVLVGLTLSSGSDHRPAEPPADDRTPEPRSAGEVSRAVVDEPVYSFGAMDPYRRRQHKFVVRNVGDAALTLRPGGTSCKCTRCDVLDPSIPPGGRGRILLEWESAGPQESYRHGAAVHTNDPDRPTLQLGIQGAVRTHLGADPPELIFSGVSPGESATGRTVVYSEAWDEFTLEDFAPSIPGLTWKCERLDAGELPTPRAKAGYRLQVALPPTLEQGEFQGYLQFEVVRPTAGDLPQTCRIPIEGKVLRRLSIYGTGIDASGRVELGALKAGQSLKLTLRMKVRDDEWRLQVTRIETVPDFLRVTIEPLDSVETTGLYRLDIEVPRDAPECTYLAPRLGKLRLEIDHPRISELELSLNLAVLSPNIDKSPHNRR